MLVKLRLRLLFECLWRPPHLVEGEPILETHCLPRRSKRTNEVYATALERCTDVHGSILQCYGSSTKPKGSVRRRDSEVDAEFIEGT